MERQRMDRVRILVAVTALATAGVPAATAQLVAAQPSEQLLLLPFAVSKHADSALSIKVTDLTRDRLTSLARFRVSVVSKAKLCEALQASGFPCDGLLDDHEARLLAQFLKVNAYTTATLESGSPLSVRMRVRDISSSGLASALTISTGTGPATPEALAEAIAQRLNTLIKAGESARECTVNRQRGAFPRALQAAQKAIAADSMALGAHLCTMLVYEAQRLSPDSQLAAANRALRIDPMNTAALETKIRIAQQRHDTAQQLVLLEQFVGIEPGNKGRVMGTAQLMYQMKQHPRAVGVLDQGLTANPGDQDMNQLRTRICIEGAIWPCALHGLATAAEHDSTLAKSEEWLRTIIGAAQQVPDTAAERHWTQVATVNFPRSAPFCKAYGSALEKSAMADSAITIYRHCLTIDPNDIATGLLVAKAMVDKATWDTSAARRCSGDTACVNRLRNGFADRLDSARTYVDKALAGPDSGLQLSASVIMLTAGSKLAQAQAFPRAYPWLDRPQQMMQPRSPADTVGPRRQVRTNVGFWYGLASVQTLAPAYTAMVASKNCTQASDINTRIARTKQALIDGARVHPPTVQSLLNNLGRFEEQMPKVKQAFKCTNF